MNYLHYILALVALIGLLPSVVYLLPGHPAHFLPAWTVGLALAVYFIPTPLDAALALVVPATFLIRVLRIDPVPTEPVNWGPTKAAVTSISGKLAAATARQLTRIPGMTPAPEPVVTEFIKPDAPFILRDTASDDAPDADVEAVDKPTLSREQARELLRQADAKRR